MNTTLIGVFQAHQEMQKAVVGDVVSRSLLLILLLAGLKASVPLAIIFTYYLVANLLNLIITYSYLRHRLPLHFAFDRSLWHLFFVEAWPLGVVTMLGVIYFKIDTVILSILRDPSDVGIYGAPYKVFEFLTIIPGLFMGTVFPVITKLITEDNDRLRRVIQAAYDVLMIIVLGTVAGLIVLARGTVGLVAGQEFVVASTITVAGQPVTAVHILMILALALIPVYLGNLWGPVVVAYGKQSALIRPGIIAVILNISLNLIFIPRGSYLAAAIVTLITESYMAWSWARVARANLPLILHQGRLARTLLAALIMMAVIWPVRNLMVVLPVGLGAAVYLTLIWLLGVIPEDFLQVIKRSEGIRE